MKILFKVNFYKVFIAKFSGSVVEQITGSSIISQPSSLEICLAPDFSGDFELSIKLEDETDLTSIIIPITVRDIQLYCYHSVFHLNI